MRYHGNGRLTLMDKKLGSQGLVAYGGKHKQRFSKIRTGRGKLVVGDIEYHQYGSQRSAPVPVLKKIYSLEKL